MPIVPAARCVWMFVPAILVTLLGACVPSAHTPVLRVPVVAASDWARPHDVDGVVIRVPVPAGFADTCADAPDELARLRALDKSVTTLGCYRRDASGEQLDARLTALRKVGDVTREEFEQFKNQLRASVTATRNRVRGYGATGEAGDAGNPAGLPGVLDELRESKDHVVHAIVRPVPGQQLVRAGTMTSVHVRGRLLYLTVLAEPGAKVDWEVLARNGDQWAETLLKRTLWTR